MSVRMTFAMLAMLIFCGVSHAKDVRWSNFAEDTDLKYYLDQKSIVSLADNVYIFWVKSVAKEKDYFKKEYNLNDISYIFTNYELDCAVSSYRVRGAIMFDKNRREINKTLPTEEAVFEPVPPESMLELAQDEICVKEEKATGTAPGRPTAAPAASAPSEAPLAPPEAPIAPEKLEAPEKPEAPERPQTVDRPDKPEAVERLDTPILPQEPPRLQ